MKKTLKLLLISVGSLFGMCLLLTIGFFVINLGLPDHSPSIEKLSEADKIRLAEYIHLREGLGNSVFPGWGEADIPAILYNEEYVFLTGYKNPQNGWVKVPAGIRRGGIWELVPDDLFVDEPYYRQRLSDPEITPEAFTVMVGDRWVSSMPTLDWFKISLVNQIKSDLPSFVVPVFPYSLFINQLVSGSDQYISLSAHEAFHSFQGMMAPDKFADAEKANQYSDQYPWDDQSLQADWGAELSLLADALRSTDQKRTLELVQQFIVLRTSRRESADLSPEQISYEQHREWLEGLARYAELRSGDRHMKAVICLFRKPETSTTLKVTLTSSNDGRGNSISFLKWQTMWEMVVFTMPVWHRLYCSTVYLLNGKQMPSMKVSGWMTCLPLQFKSK